MSRKVADIIVETLQSAGVKHCYGVVGDTLNHIAGGLSRSSIEWVSVRHEEAGAFAAQAEALATGHLTAAAGSCGPGSLHFINGIFEANRNRAPVAAIHAGRAGNWDGTLCDPCGFARSRWRRLGDGEGEFSLIEALFV